MPELTTSDLNYVVRRLPKDVRDLLTENAGRLFVGGGFIRATVAGEEPSDIDLFGASKEFLGTMADLLMSRRLGSRLHKSKNAITLITPDRLQVQFITRWTFPDLTSLIASFDFTVCQAAIGRASNRVNSEWLSAAGEGFYVDLAGRRLVYTSPVRDEEAGGSMLRVMKFLKRGYTIQVHSLGGVVSRLVQAVEKSQLADSEAGVAQILTGLLREVDPLLVVDGVDIVDEHETAAA